MPKNSTKKDIKLFLERMLRGDHELFINAIHGKGESENVYKRLLVTFERRHYINVWYLICSSEGFVQSEVEASVTVAPYSIMQWWLKSVL